MEFEWDENKNLENIKNHDGISFEKAVSAFFDNWALEVFDETHSDAKERRFTLVGLAGERLLRLHLAGGGAACPAGEQRTGDQTATRDRGAAQ